MKGCSCGTPSLATYYVSYIIGTEDNTEEVSGYWCALHVPSESDVESSYPLTDGNGTWQLIEHPMITELR